MIHDNRGFPLVSIIIVNFNGQHLLESCLSVIFKLDYPQNKIEVILVDNNSSDDSVPFVTNNFPKVKIIQNGENLGFTGGNNEGYKAATGEYIVLLNSDVVVDKKWLSALVNRAECDPKIGIVGSRLRYAIPFVELLIQSAAVPRSKVFRTIDHSPIGVLIEEVLCETPALSQSVYYKNGFYEKQQGEIPTRRTKGDAQVLLPFKDSQESNTYLITLHGLESTEEFNIPVNLVVGGKTLRSLKLKSHETIQVELTIPKTEVKESFLWLVQNAGNALLHNGYGKDIGSVVVTKETEQKEFYEEESAYFNQEKELLAACGASMLIKREVIDHVGFLNGTYFMYYEDVEFCLRAWRAGWKIFYEPLSIGYHKHRATTGNEESAFFLNLVERNHLAFVITHFPMGTLIEESVLFFLRFAMTLTKFIVFQFKDNEIRSEIWRRKYGGRSAALIFILKSWPSLLRNRYKMNSYWPIDYKKLEKMLY